MLEKDKVNAEEENIREMVRDLTDDRRAEFYRLAGRELKDPDTYATLNYLFIAGLHHFYLGKWEYGLVNIGIFWIGVILLFMGQMAAGLLAIAGVTLFELYALFRSQIIVQDHNNRTMRRIYREVTRT